MSEKGNALLMLLIVAKSNFVVEIFNVKLIKNGMDVHKC